MTNFPDIANRLKQGNLTPDESTRPRGRPRRDTGALTYGQWYYRHKRGERPTRRQDPKKRCAFCDIFLSSKFGSKFGRKYCDSCRQSKRIKRILHARYQRTAYHKKYDTNH